MRTREILLNVGILALSCLFAVVVAEFVARKMIGLPEFPRYYVGEFENRPSRNFAVDEHTGWRMQSDHTFRWRAGIKEEKNSYTSNQDGFRSPREFTGNGSIVVIGDSFTFGTGVEYPDTFGAVLEYDLQTLPVYNLAMPGFGIDQMWMALRHQAPNYNPELIIIAFIDGDLDRSLTAFRKAEGMNKPTFILEDGKLRPRTASDRPPGLVTSIERRLALGGLLRVTLDRIGFTLPLGSWWTLNAGIFTQMIRDAEAAGVPLLFVRLPTRGENEFPTLDAFMASQGADFIDLEAITNSSHGEEIFIPEDNHINEEGHRIVATAIRQWVVENLPALAATAR